MFQKTVKVEQATKLGSGLMSTIAIWLHEHGLGKYADTFVENEVDMQGLPLLSEDDLRDLGLPLGARRSLQAAIARLAAPSAEQTAPSAERKAPPRSEAERRQLTVMFCDLVDSTALSDRMDPEDFRSVIRAYQGAVTDAVKRYDGYIARYMGDGLLVYFGYPYAHEEDAERAVRAGLDTVSAVSHLDTAAIIELNVRVGIATGIVIAGDIIGEGSSEERAVLGDVPNLASRLQGMASPGSVLVSEQTHDLVRGLFVVRELHDLQLKGIGAAVTAFEVLGLGDVPNRFEAAAQLGLTPLVARKEEIELLHGRWDRARGGESQLVLLSGEPGFGKSRIVRGLLDRIEHQVYHRVLQFCSPHYQHSAFHPIVDQLVRDMNFRRADSQEEKLGKLDAMLGRLELSPRDHGPPLASLLSIAGASHAQPPDWGPPELRRHIFASLGAVYAAMARQGATLVVLEDAHWIDPSSEELFGRLLVELQTLPLMIVVTHRPEYAAPWARHSTRLYVDKLTTEECGELIANLTAGKKMPRAVVDQIVARTDGVPLFAEELAKTIIDSGALRDRGDHFDIVGDVSTLGIPSSLQDSLTARLDRLGSSKGVAQLAAVIGRRFERDLLAKLSPLSERELASALEKLLRTGLVHRLPTEFEDAFEFKHALVQESAYQSLLRTTRREAHERTASTIEREYPGLADAQPETVAHHYTEAGIPEKAVQYWQKAGQVAIEKSANHEAESHARRGLRVLQQMPRTVEWQRRYARLQNALGVALMPTRGFGDKEVGEAFTAAAEASEAIDDRRGLFIALRGLGQYLFISGNVRSAATHAGRVMSLAEELGDWGSVLEAHHLAWITQTFAGNYAVARMHAEVGIAKYRRERDHILTHIYTGHDPGVCCRSFCALPTWQLGYPDRSARLFQDGEDLAQQLGHPFSIAVSLWAKAMHQNLCRDVYATWDAARALVEFCERGGFGGAMYRMGYVLKGWADAMNGELTSGIAQMQRSMHQLSGTERNEFGLPGFYAQLAQLKGKAGDAHDGLAAIETGLVLAEKNGDYFSWPELQRVKGELLLMESADRRPEANACFQNAMRSAQRQEARMLELRAATSLAELWGWDGRREASQQLLAPLYAQFTEGFNTMDLRGAKDLLNHLS